MPLPPHFVASFVGNFVGKARGKATPRCLAPWRPYRLLLLQFFVQPAQVARSQVISSPLQQ